MRSKNVPLASAIALLGGTAFTVTKPALTFQMKALGASALLVGFLTSAYFLSRSLGSLIAVKAYKRFRLVSLLFLAASAISLLYEGADPLKATILRFLHGLVLGAAWTEIQMLVSVSTRYVATAFSIYFLFGSLALPLGNFLYATFPKGAFKLSALLFLLVSLLCLLLEPKEGKRGKNKGKAILLFLVFILLFRIASSFPNTDVVYLYLNEFFKMRETQTSLIVGLASLIGLPLSLILSYISDTVGDKPSFIVIVILTVFGMLMVNTPFVVLGLALMMVSAKIFVPISRRIAVKEAGKEGVGYLNFFNSLGMVISGILYGYALDTNLIVPILDLLAIAVAILSLKILKSLS